MQAKDTPPVYGVGTRWSDEDQRRIDNVQSSGSTDQNYTSLQLLRNTGPAVSYHGYSNITTENR